MKKPDLNVQEWAVLSQAFHLVVGELLAKEGDGPSAVELEIGWGELRGLLEAEWGHPGADSDQMAALRAVMDSVWEAAIPALKAARPRRIRQPDLFDGEPEPFGTQNL